LHIEINIIFGHDATYLDYWTSIFCFVVRVLGLFFIFNETAKGLVLFCSKIVALSFIWVPHLAMFCGSIPSQYKYAFPIGESLTYQKH